MAKRDNRLPIFFIISYIAQLLFLFIILEQYFTNIAWENFHISCFPISPTYGIPITLFMRLVGTEDTLTLIYMVLTIIILIPYAVLWGLFYLLLHKKQKGLPSKKTIVSWVCFLVIGFVQWLVYSASESSLFEVPTFYWEYCYYAVPIVIMIIFLIFNILDFVRFLKTAKKETTA